MRVYQFAHFQFDPDAGCLFFTESDTEQEIILRHKVANLLNYLLEHRERIVSKEELLDKLWDHGDYRENALTQSIRELRKALGDKAQQPVFIRTFPQRGYQWIAEVTIPVIDPACGEMGTGLLNPELSTPGRTNPETTTPESALPEQEKPEQENPERTNSEPAKTLHRAMSGLFITIIALIFLLTSSIWLLKDTLLAGLSSHTFALTGPNTNKTEQHINTGIAARTLDVQGNLNTDQAGPSVLVLPFINETGDTSMAWLELGLSDMLATELQRSYGLNIVSPAVSNHLLLSSEINWPALPVQIRTLLKQEKIDAALFADVRLHNRQQVLDFKVIYADGKAQQGSVSYGSLPASVASVAQQLVYLLQPERKQHHSDSVAGSDPVAAQALAEGIQYLQTEGANQARRYFQASLIVEPDNHWARARMAQIQLLAGQWTFAEKEMELIPDIAREEDAGLNAFIDYWLAELALRRGADDETIRIKQAITSAKRAADHYQMARSYRLKARQAWRDMDWPEHRHWLREASQLMADSSELQTQAENLFYLGNPSNEGLEKSPGNDLRQNQKYLIKALNFYQQLGHQPMIAATQLAIAQNYSLPLSQREDALEQSINLYRQLQQPYELAQALIYAGFYQMQLHNGHKAYALFEQAHALAKQIGASNLLSFTRFYMAFATLDQGLDQTEIAGHGRDAIRLRSAIEQLNEFIADDPAPLLKASSLVFLGWAWTDLGDYEQALSYLHQAREIHQSFNMPITASYASYSIMRIYLEQKNYSAVIALEGEPITTRLQAVYLARAWFEAGQAAQSVRVLQDFRQQLPDLWQKEDSLRLGQYLAAQKGSEIRLGPEPMAHLVYCESDWAMER
ncbi:winged helix-turn-helix domain-containing protein [Oceanospirillum sediminis]|uniref:Winged helix-turn-helix domain-containing protein n=1 Tax=Oceanospirillum sediminis TaxID=2760088 RepID=A0A839ITL4_9GAMM|nr:winged helix-turn-helix domain-containing protein [Oceanospirillum sediminis]MBB1488020.1 winged helix-turn-helix domain-containing protein [Oceanospirillum sediminis]